MPLIITGKQKVSARSRAIAATCQAVSAILQQPLPAILPQPPALPKLSSTRASTGRNPNRLPH